MADERLHGAKEGAAGGARRPGAAAERRVQPARGRLGRRRRRDGDGQRLVILNIYFMQHVH